MKRYYIIILIFFIPIGLIAQTDCVDFDDYDSSQVWIKEIIKLDNQSQKDSIIKRIACERIIGKQNVKVSLDCIFDGLFVQEIPEYTRGRTERRALVNTIIKLKIGEQS